MWRRRSGIGSWIEVQGFEPWEIPNGHVTKLLTTGACMLICVRFEFSQRRIILNLAPADLPKEDGRFDLAIALGILAASGQIDAQSLERFESLGELALIHEMRSVDSFLSAAIDAARDGRSLIAAAANGAEAAPPTSAYPHSALESGALPPAVAASALPVSIPDLRHRARPATDAPGDGSRGGRRASPVPAQQLRLRKDAAGLAPARHPARRQGG